MFQEQLHEIIYLARAQGTAVIHVNKKTWSTEERKLYLQNANMQRWTHYSRQNRGRFKIQGKITAINSIYIFFFKKQKGMWFTTNSSQDSYAATMPSGKPFNIHPSPTVLQVHTLPSKGVGQKKQSQILHSCTQATCTIRTKLGPMAKPRRVSFSDRICFVSRKWSRHLIFTVTLSLVDDKK